MSKQIKKIKPCKPNQVGHPLWDHSVVGECRN